MTDNTHEATQTVEEWEKEWGKEFNFASFTWNGDNATGEMFAKKTERKVKRFIRKTLTQERTRLKEEIEKELLDAVQIRDKYFPHFTGEPTPNEGWAEIVIWKDAHNTGVHTALSKLGLTSKD